MPPSGLGGLPISGSEPALGDAFGIGRGIGMRHAVTRGNPARATTAYRSDASSVGLAATAFIVRVVPIVMAARSEPSKARRTKLIIREDSTDHSPRGNTHGQGRQEDQEGQTVPSQLRQVAEAQIEEDRAQNGRAGEVAGGTGATRRTRDDAARREMCLARAASFRFRAYLFSESPSVSLSSSSSLSF